VTPVKSNRNTRRAAAATRTPKAAASPPGLLLKATWTVLGWLILILSAIWGFQSLQAYAGTADPVHECVVEWTAVPDWMTDEILASIEEQAGLPMETHFADPNLCPLLGARIAGSPWVAQVNSVIKQRTGQGRGVIRIAATFRKPFAFVVHAGTAQAVDRAGIRLPYAVPLPPEKDLGESWGRWWLIKGVGSDPPRDGEAWPGEDLAAGLQLAEFLHKAREAPDGNRVPFRDWLWAIDVANYKARVDPYQGALRIELTTAEGPYYVHWGKPPGQEYGTEPSGYAKLEKLRAVYLRNPEQFGASDLDPRQPDATPARVGRWWLERMVR